MSTIRPVTTVSGKQPPFGLVAWLEKTRLHLPLKGVECRFDVCGDVVDVEMDQIFYQSAGKPLECLYSFPLPAGATVHRCEMHVNDRVIRARVEEEKAAREIYEQKKAEGRRAALVETVRDNFFTLSLGNIQPGDVVVMRFAYFQTVERDPAGQLSIRVPVCPGVRYIPGKPLLRDLTGAGTADDTDQVPDASRISPPRIDALHPDAAYFCINGRIDRSIADLASIASPTHMMFLRESDTAYLAGLADGSAVPDRDFVLRWNEPAVTAPTPLAWTYRENDATYALVQLRAPAIEKASDDYEQDFYFLLDRSGSMGGAKWVKTCEALKAFIRLLGPGDRAWITFFESNFCDFAEVPMSPAAIAREKAFKNIERLGVAGGTELLPALRHILEKVDIHSPDRNASILLLTDGQIGNEKGVFDCMAARPALKVHTFGIDTAVNDAFLKQLASRQRGQCFLQTPNDDIAGMVARLGARLRRPVLTGISEEDGNWQLASGAVPDLFSSEIIDISAWSESHASSIVFSGALPDGAAHTLRITPLAVNNRAVLLLCIRARIETLIAAGDKEQAITLARTYNILCEGASFVAWDDAEQVSIGSDTIYQPSLEQSVAYCASPMPGVGMGGKDVGTLLAGAPSQALKRRSRSPGLRGLFKSGSWGRLKDEAEPSPSILRGSRLFEDAGDGTPPNPQSDQSPESFARWEERGNPDLVARLKKLRKQARGVVFLDTDNGRCLLDAICHCIVTEDAELAGQRIKLLSEILLVTRALDNEQKAARLWRSFLDQHYFKTAIYPTVARLFLSYS